MHARSLALDGACTDIDPFSTRQFHRDRGKIRTGIDNKTCLKFA